MTEFERGFEQGKQSVQPRWISVEERLPERNGDYFAVSESLNDYPIGPKGSVCAGWATFTDGRWEDDMYDSWKVKLSRTPQARPSRLSLTGWDNCATHQSRHFPTAYLSC